jgi:hypothetical protein
LLQPSRARLGSHPSNFAGFQPLILQTEEVDMMWNPDSGRIFVIFAAVASAATSACAGVTPTTKALEIQRLQCEGAQDAADDANLMQATKVLAVVPMYSQVHSATTGTESRVSGVKLLIRPPETFSADRTLRVLQCHGARGVLGRLDPSQVPDDPYWLPGTWVDIDLVHEAGNFVVTVQAGDIHKNLQLVARARAFALTHSRAAWLPRKITAA